MRFESYNCSGESMELYLSVFLWPLITLVMVSLVLMSLNYLLAVSRPQVRIQRVLFDKKFRDRHPVAVALSWISVIILWLACNALVYGDP